MALDQAASGRNGQATLKDVASHAGVSQMTVSRVINSPAAVREETRAKVLDAILALNYRPNLSARSLAGGTSLFIGLILNNPSNNYLSELLVGGLDACRTNGHHLVLCELTDEDARDPIEHVRALRHGGLDALILASPRSDDPAIAAAIREVGLPYVLISPGRATPQSLSVAIDNTKAATDVSELLIARGHTAIGFIEGPADQTASGARRKGFERAMSAAGLRVEPAFMERGDFTYRSGMEAGDRLLSLKDRPTAIFASNDDMAAGLMAAAFRAGLSVPDDLSVVGFDDTGIAAAVWPGLTTVRQPIREMAVRAVEIVSESVRSDRPLAPRQEYLETALVERGSVASRPR